MPGGISDVWGTYYLAFNEQQFTLRRHGPFVIHQLALSAYIIKLPLTQRAILLSAATGSNSEDDLLVTWAGCRML